jgi:glycosyltransferase involved in cell wall biosynthesis
LAGRGDRLIAYETAGDERTYPWERLTDAEAFDRVVLFPDRTLEEIPAGACAEAMTEALDRDRPDALGVVGYARPESMAMARWARRNRRPSVLMSESQSVDRPRVWYKEMIKSRRVSLFDAGFVGGPSHRDYLVDLGMPADRVALGYNAVDNPFYEARAEAWRNQHDARDGLPAAPYFLSVARFAPEKNLIRLIEAFARYRSDAGPGRAWYLVLCGGGPLADEVERAVARSGFARAIHRPGFLQADALSRWYAFAGGFVLASASEPWGLVANEAAAAGLPLLISSRAGCAETLVPDPEWTTGARFDPLDPGRIAGALRGLAERPEAERHEIGRRAREVASAWGPERFAQGAVEAWEIARRSPRRRASLLRKGR